MPTVVLVGTFDTKGDEYAFLRDRVAASGCEVVMVNAGALGDAGYPVEFDRADVAAAAGADVDVLAASGDRGVVVTTMAEGAAAIVLDLYEAGRLHGILGMGGSGGSSPSADTSSAEASVACRGKAPPTAWSSSLASSIWAY